MSDAARPSPLVAVEDLHASYGESHVLHGMNFTVGKGELVTLIGRNGAGKSTTIKCLIGMLASRTGSIRIGSIETIALPARQIARLGVGYVPENRGIYASLTVAENLFLPPTVKPGGFAIDRIMAMFPNLPERMNSQGNRLSGGEQQMLAIARVLRTGADLLLLDEPTEGLAPVIVQRIEAAIQELKAAGLTIILVEQNVRFAARVADRHYVVEEGRVVDTFSADDISADMNKVLSYLGV